MNMKKQPETYESIDEITLGAYMHKAQAEQDILEFKKENAYIYRSDIFPNPASFNITYEIQNAEIIEKPDAMNVIYPYSVKLTIKAKGAPDAVRRWFSVLKDKVRIAQ